MRGGYLVILDCKSNLLRENNGFLEYPVSSVYPICLYQYISIDSSVSGLVLTKLLKKMKTAKQQQSGKVME